MKNFKNLLPIAAFIFGLTVVLTQSAFKAAKKNPHRTSYFFQYNGIVGNEADRTLWSEVSNDEPACGNENDGCLIEVDASFTTGTPGSRTLTANVPVTSGAHQNPIIGSMVLAASNKNP